MPTKGKGKGTKAAGEKKATPKNAKRYKEPPKDRVGIVASSMQDVYEVADTLIGAGMGMFGKPYPPGLFQLKGDTAEKMARSMCQINDALPAMAERLNKYSAPAIFVSTFLTDLAVKGVVLYGCIKSPTPSPRAHGTTQGQPGTTH